MTLLQLIVQVVNYTKQDDTTINESNLQTYLKSENYSAIIKNALMETNRAIQEILPYLKTEVSTASFGIPNTNVRSISIDLSSFDPNLYRVQKAYYEDVNGRIVQTPFKIRNKKVMSNIFLAKTFYVEYYPRVPVFTEADLNGSTYYEDEDNAQDTSVDLTKYGVSDYICMAVIPHLAKSKLWQELEPELAQLERNEGLQNLLAYDNGDYNMESQNEVFVQSDWSDD